MQYLWEIFLNPGPLRSPFFAQSRQSDHALPILFLQQDRDHFLYPCFQNISNPWDKLISAKRVLTLYASLSDFFPYYSFILFTNRGSQTGSLEYL